MVWLNSIVLYVISIYIWTWILWLANKLLISFQAFLAGKLRKRQMLHLLNMKIPNLVRSIKFEMFIKDKIIKITPKFPFHEESYEEIKFEVRKNYDTLLFYLERLSPFRISSVILIILIIRYYLHIRILSNIFHLITWKNIIKNIKGIGNPLPFITPSIALILLFCALYFVSRSGLFRKAKNKIKVEEIENKIKFHKENRMLLSYLVLKGYDNLDYMIKSRLDIISKIKEYKDKDKDKNKMDISILKNEIDYLEDFKEIEDLDNFVQKSKNKNRDLFPFFLDTNHVSFLELHLLYNENNFNSKLNKIFLTRKHLEFIILNYPLSNLENYINWSLLDSAKTVVMINKYLNSIHNLINKPTTIYSFFAFIINKDK